MHFIMALLHFEEYVWQLPMNEMYSFSDSMIMQSDFLAVHTILGMRSHQNLYDLDWSNL